MSSDRPILLLRGLLLLVFFAAVHPGWADDASTGINGIHSQGLGLTGRGIAIGQVEPERPGLPGFDDAAHSNPTVIPAGVFVRNGPAIANSNTSNHAEQVAGVMIAGGQGHRPVSLLGHRSTRRLTRELGRILILSAPWPHKTSFYRMEAMFAQSI